MAKKRYSWDERKIQKYIKDGRGTGTDKHYKPWLEIHDVPSQGRSSRIHGWKTDRLHHFLSDNERSFFYLLEWADNVIDIQGWRKPFIYIPSSDAVNSFGANREAKITLMYFFSLSQKR